MRWASFWDQQAGSGNSAVQVGRIVEGKPTPPELNREIARHIARLLKLEPHHQVLDVCCGNGELTALLAAQCGRIVGVDFSAQQLAHAQKHLSHHDNLEFIRGDAQSLQLQQTFDRINLYFSFQYITGRTSANRVLSGLFRHLNPGGMALLGDIPDAEREIYYYNTRKKLLRARIQSLLGRNPMGRFWHPEALSQLARNQGFTTQISPEPAHLPYASYRFDLLLTRHA